ncbi:MAG: copper chaperone PCu(A)C [Desertimonas sp.]
MNTPRRSWARRSLAGGAVVVLALGVSACGDDDDEEEASATTVAANTATTTAAETTIEVDASDTDNGDDEQASAIAVTDVWARSSPMAASAGAAYMTITNEGDDDALTGVAVDPSVAATVELHETRAADGEMSESMTTGTGMMTEDTDSAPMMEMVEVERIDIASGETVTLAPGGYHLMLLDLVEPLEVGDEIDVTLTFESAGEIVVTAVVAEQAP